MNVFKKLNEKNQHDEMLDQLKPFIEYLQANGFQYFINVAKDGLAANYISPTRAELTSCLGNLVKRNKQVESLLADALNHELL